MRSTLRLVVWYYTQVLGGTLFSRVIIYQLTDLFPLIVLQPGQFVELLVHVLNLEIVGIWKMSMQSINLSIYQSINLSIYQYINISIYQSINLLLHCWDRIRRTCHRIPGHRNGHRCDKEVPKIINKVFTLFNVMFIWTVLRINIHCIMYN